MGYTLYMTEEWESTTTFPIADGDFNDNHGVSYIVAFISLPGPKQWLEDCRLRAISPTQGLIF